MRTTIAVFDKKGMNAALMAIKALDSFRPDNDSHFVLATHSAVLETEDIDELQKNRKSSQVAIGCLFLKSKRGKPTIILDYSAAFLLEGLIYSPTNSNVSSLLSFDQPSGLKHEKKIENLITRAEGDFFSIIAEPKRILAGRDAMGVQPLYYGENEDFAAFGTNRTTLWKLGITETCSVPPGNVICVSSGGFESKPVRALTFSKPQQITLGEAAETLRRLLERSIRARLRDVREIAVGFSGGLDSSVVALLAKRCKVQVNLVHVSLRGKPETEEAKRAAEEMKLPLSVFLFGPEDVKKAVAKVVELIEEPDPLGAAIGIPFLWITKKTAETGLNTLLTGQGADELFGGYKRYVDTYLLHGPNRACEMMFNDVLRLHERSLERDKKICDFHNLELCLPFVSYRIAKFALSLPLELKIEKEADGLRKVVLRQMALNMGLPKVIVNKPKKAIQYASGVDAALKKIAKSQDITVKALVEQFFQKKSDS